MVRRYTLPTLLADSDLVLIVQATKVKAQWPRGSPRKLFQGRYLLDFLGILHLTQSLHSTTIKPGQPYGEVCAGSRISATIADCILARQIWLGSTHKNGPCTVHNGLNRGKLLKDLIQSDPDFYLGQKLLSNSNMQDLYKNDLPFLFKILSFNKALPLQAHPDPSLGSKLKKQEKEQQGKNENCKRALLSHTTPS